MVVLTMMKRTLVALIAMGPLGCAAEVDDSASAEAEVISETQQAGGFKWSCGEYHVHPNGLLEGDCADFQGHAAWTSLDLNYGIANDNGHLHWRAGGGYAPSCSGCRIERGWMSEGWQVDFSNLECECRALDGSWVSTSIDLNDQISNQNGQLAFDF